MPFLGMRKPQTALTNFRCSHFRSHSLSLAPSHLTSLTTVYAFSTSTNHRDTLSFSSHLCAHYFRSSPPYLGKLPRSPSRASIFGFTHLWRQRAKGHSGSRNNSFETTTTTAHNF